MPRFQVAVDDCDLAPAEFAMGESEPIVVARNGTVYGQVFRVEGGIELHFYHLWATDCERVRHALDAEHVAGLLRYEAGEWRAKYWYTAAHENTVCDASAGAQAARIFAEWRGPEVWISRGKHASFLTEAACHAGCGSDRCDQSQAMQVRQLINLGEIGAPMNGADWVGSTAWALGEKMKSNFSSELLEELDRSKGVIAVSSVRPGVKPVIGAASSTMDAIGVANAKTGKAIDRASRAVKSWLWRRLD